MYKNSQQNRNNLTPFSQGAEKEGVLFQSLILGREAFFRFNEVKWNLA